MAHVRPFKGLHPSSADVSRTVSRSLDQYDRQSLDRILSSNPDSFLNVVRPEHGKELKSPANSKELFEKSRDVFDNMCQRGLYRMDPKPAFYIYTQHVGTLSYTGIIGRASVEDYDDGLIRIHEQTIASREKVLRDYLAVCEINADPVCFTYPRNGSLELLIEIVRQGTPILDFEDDEGKKHQLWRVDDPQWTAKFTEKLGCLEHVYIADGHHRSASSVLYAHDRWLRSERITGQEPYNFFLGIYFPDDQLRIYEFNRVVRDLADMGVAQLLEELSVEFEVHFRHQVAIRPEEPGTFGMYLAGNWYKLICRNRRSTETVAALDVSILSDRILSPMLNIKDQRNDSRLRCVPGTKGLRELTRLVDSGRYSVAFTMFPVSGKEFYAIADQGKTMPPKSTYIVPKLLSGLLIYSLRTE